MSNLDLLRNKKFWYTTFSGHLPLRHMVAKEAADEIERLRAIVDSFMKFRLCVTADAKATYTKRKADEYNKLLDSARNLLREKSC